MIPPAIAIVWVGHRRSIPLPIALFLFWPIAAVAAAAGGVTGWIAPAGSRLRARANAICLSLRLLAHLSGLRIDVRSNTHTEVRIWIV